MDGGPAQPAVPRLPHVVVAAVSPARRHGVVVRAGCARSGGPADGSHGGGRRPRDDGGRCRLGDRGRGDEAVGFGGDGHGDVARRRAVDVRVAVDPAGVDLAHLRKVRGRHGPGKGHVGLAQAARRVVAAPLADGGGVVLLVGALQDVAAAVAQVDLADQAVVVGIERRAGRRGEGGLLVAARGGGHGGCKGQPESERSHGYLG